LKILVVRLRLIGDVGVTTPLLRGAARQYPDAHLTYLVEPLAEPIVRGNPHLDEILVIPLRSGLARIRDDIAFARRLRREHYDIVPGSARGPAQRVADMGERRTHADRLHHARAQLDVYASVPGPEDLGPPIPCSSSGSC
jgi:hypothetical protein